MIATDAPFDATRLHDVAKIAALGLGRNCVISHVSSGDLFIAFSTTHRYPRGGGISGPPLETDEDRVDAVFGATVDATEEAIDDAIFSARTMVGANGVTLYGLPFEQVSRSSPDDGPAPEATACVRRIEALLAEAEPIVARGGATDEASFSLRETRTRYLPDTINAYLNVPPSLRSQPDGGGNPRPSGSSRSWSTSSGRPRSASRTGGAQHRGGRGRTNGSSPTASAPPSLPPAEPVPTGSAPPATLVHAFFDRIAGEARGANAPLVVVAAQRFGALVPQLLTLRRGAFGMGPVEAFSLDIPCAMPCCATRSRRGAAGSKRARRRSCAASRCEPRPSNSTNGYAASTKISGRTSSATPHARNPHPVPGELM